MLNLPKPPHTRISRQLTCVSCHEQFTIAEDDPRRDDPHSPNWLMPAEDYPDVQLRYESDRSRRSVAPESQAHPRQNAGDYSGWDNDRHDSINCPRCGADNRNWLHILNPPFDVDANELNERAENWFLRPDQLRILGYIVSAVACGLFVFNFFWEKPQNIWFEITNTIIVCLLLTLPFLFSPVSTMVRMRYARQKYGVVAFGIVLAMGLVYMAGYFHFHWGKQVVQSIIFLLVIGLAGIVPILTGLGTWLRHREFVFLRSVIPAAAVSERISPPLRSWLAYTALFLFIIPFLFYILFPGVLHFVSTLIEPAPVTAVPTLEQRVNNILGELEIVLVQAPPGTIEPAAEAIDDLVAFLEGVPLPVAALDNLSLDQKAAITLTWANDLLKNASEQDKAVIQNAITDLEKFVADADLNVTPAAAPAPSETTTDGLPSWMRVEKAFLENWFKYVLAASITSLVFSQIAVNRYVRHINLQLPPPIYHSLANMTRVVIWEARRALEIGDELKYIQWTAVQRNEYGGVMLEGFYRDDSLMDLPDSPPTTKVRAQRYQIVSDRWGHILSSNIRTAHVYRLPRRSLPGNMDIGDEFFVNVPARLVESERP